MIPHLTNGLPQPVPPGSLSPLFVGEKWLTSDFLLPATLPRSGPSPTGSENLAADQVRIPSLLFSHGPHSGLHPAFCSASSVPCSSAQVSVQNKIPIPDSPLVVAHRSWDYSKTQLGLVARPVQVPPSLRCPRTDLAKVTLTWTQEGGLWRCWPMSMP